jgi:hypothetical protein
LGPSEILTRLDPSAGKNFRKIQSICNGKCASITIQGLATAREKPPAQKQWQAMEKTMRRAIGTVGKSGRVLTSGWTPDDRATALRANRRQVDATLRHPRDARVTMKKPADVSQKQAMIAQIRD